MRILLPLRAALSVASILPLLTACDQWALLVNTDGVLAIVIVSDGHSSRPFQVRTRDADGVSRLMVVPPSGSLAIDGVKAGQVELTLLAPTGCRVASPNPQTVMTQAAETVRVSFDVHC
jgi:hypothetical protein